MSSPEEVLVRTACDELLQVDPQSQTTQEFLGRQFDLGLAWVQAPVGLGGLAVDTKLQRVVTERLRAAHAPSCYPINPLGHGMAAPTILEHGSDQQRQRYLRPLFTTEEIWCQLFSEPGAGSDLASVATKARRDGDQWIVDGQKVWTTLGHVARWGLLLARSDSRASRHEGLTFFLLDMHSPGVEVRPLFQMTGEAEFNEIFLQEVRVPDSARLGGVGDGWRVARSTLMSERVAIGGGTPRRGGGVISECMKTWDLRGGSAVQRDQLAGLWIRAEVQRLTNLRASERRAAGQAGPEGSIGKIAAARLLQDLTDLAVDLLGPEGMLMPGGYPMERVARAFTWSGPQHALLRSRANSIEGGTTEIAKTIVAERVLGLPRTE